MVAGILIPCEEGVRWYDAEGGEPLPKDHSADSSVRLELQGILTDDMGKALSVTSIPRINDSELRRDFLVVTQFQRGEWMHDGPDIFDVPRFEDRMKETSKEVDMRRILSELGLNLNGSNFECHYQAVDPSKLYAW
ncbi:hypothetical protein FB45DRAFT_1028513 [Roridomyces roridus]|uniref:Uncharacterized protein n=1 Tax=Roridomyces roridus TaxID=1738132 RepID=A0AAD7BR74_9AGAR|nr:hypothetical protein FB45DRAFT_1028513 [Roridomyces roridus]